MIRATTGRQTGRARTAPLVFGLLLIGIGGTAALSQTSLTLVQAASVLVLLCGAVLLSFFIDRARSAPSG